MQARLVLLLARGRNVMAVGDDHSPLPFRRRQRAEHLSSQTMSPGPCSTAWSAIRSPTHPGPDQRLLEQAQQAIASGCNTERTDGPKPAGATLSDRSQARPWSAVHGNSVRYPWRTSPSLPRRVPVFPIEVSLNRLGINTANTAASLLRGRAIATPWPSCGGRTRRPAAFKRVLDNVRSVGPIVRQAYDASCAATPRRGQGLRQEQGIGRNPALPGWTTGEPRRPAPCWPRARLLPARDGRRLPETARRQAGLSSSAACRGLWRT